MIKGLILTIKQQKEISHPMTIKMCFQYIVSMVRFWVKFNFCDDYFKSKGLSPTDKERE